MFDLDLSPQFRRKLRRFLRQHPEYDPIVAAALDRLRANPYDPRLGLHALSGQFAGQHAIRLSRPYRIRLFIVVRERTIELLNIGTHDEVY